MRTHTRLISVVCSLIATVTLACKDCKDTGYVFDYEECPLCEGYANVSPAWFDLDVGVTRWTETTYWTGLQTISDKRHKTYSFKNCPYCAKSMKKGAVKTIVRCKCGQVFPKQRVDNAEAKIKSVAKQNKIPLDDYMGLSEFDALKLENDMKNWSASGKAFKNLFIQAYTKNFNHEAAHYKRDESKYQTKKYIGE